jgi:hypothetical protein
MGKTTIKQKAINLYKTIKPYLTIKMILCFGIAWGITNGWSYLAVLFGWLFNIGWLLTIGLTYQAFLWLPFTIEKPITFAIGVWLYQKLFKTKPNIQ